MSRPTLTPYAFPVAPDGHRGPNTCDACHRGEAVYRETATDAVYCSETCAHRHHPP